MENVFLTSLTTPEVRQLFRQELVNFFSENPLPPKEIIQPEPEQRFDIDGLAEYLQCSKMTVHNLKKDGQLPYYRLGRKIYFKKSEIDQIARVKGIRKGGIK